MRIVIWKPSFKSIKSVIASLSLGLSLSVVANDPIGTPEGRVVREAESRLIPLSRISYRLMLPFFKPAFAHASSADSVTIPSDHTIAFVHATVLTMLSEEVLTDYTVVAQNGIIIDLGPSDLVAIPSESITIDATSKWLMPGLADMHTHVKVEGDLLVYLANGITSILNMGNNGVDLLGMRERVRSGLLIGPTIYAASLTGGPGDQFSPSLTVSTEREARQHVQLSKAQGYEYIKVYDHLAPDLFHIVLEEASVLGMPVVGHARIAPGIEFMLHAGLVMVAHLEEYLWGFFIDAQTFSWDPSRVPDAIAFTLANQATVTTTLSVNEALAVLIGDFPAYQNVLLQRDGVAYVAPSTLQDWMDRAQAQSERSGLRQLALDVFAFQKQYSKSFHDAGVLLMLGTDSPVIPGLVPGFSLHEEMRILSEAGISNYDILVMGTRQAGTFMQQHLTDSVPFGTIGVGHRADLILLDNSPLQNLSSLKDRAGVMVRGTWYSEADLRSMLDALARSYMN